MNPKEATVATYNAAARAWAEKFNSIGPRTEDIERGLSLIHAPSPFVLEIGCGNGREATEIIKYTKRYIGIDISHSMIEMARERNLDAEFILADVDTYDFPQGLDAIFAFASLLHSDPEEFKRVLHKSHKALNSGGIFYISLKYGEGSRVQTDAFGPRTFYLYTPKSLEMMYEGLFESVLEDVYEMGDQKWFTVALRKL